MNKLPKLAAQDKSDRARVEPLIEKCGRGLKFGGAQR